MSLWRNQKISLEGAQIACLLAAIVIIGICLPMTGACGLEELLARRDRPSVADLLLQDPSLNTDAFQTSDPGDAWAKNYRERLANLIVFAETAYPGLRYAVLGRDSVLLGDALDAFYIARGEPGRVVRIEASRDTLDDSDENVFDLLRESGFQPRSDGLAKPFVILDRTKYEIGDSFRHTSQAMRLLSAGLKGVTSLFMKPNDMKGQLGLIALDDERWHNPLPTPDASAITSFFKNWTLLPRQVYDKSSASPAPRGILAPASTLRIDVTNLLGRDGMPNWHGSFGKLTRTGFGKLTTYPGEVSDSNRLELGSMVRVIREVMTIDFAREVESKARAYSGLFSDLPKRLNSSSFTAPSSFRNLEISTQKLTPSERLRRVEFVAGMKSEKNLGVRLHLFTELVTYSPATRTAANDLAEAAKSDDELADAAECMALLARLDAAAELFSPANKLGSWTRRERASDEILAIEVVLQNLERIAVWKSRMSEDHLSPFDSQFARVLSAVQNLKSEPGGAKLIAKIAGEWTKTGIGFASTAALKTSSKAGFWSRHFGRKVPSLKPSQTFPRQPLETKTFDPLMDTARLIYETLSVSSPALPHRPEGFGRRCIDVI